MIQQTTIDGRPATVAYFNDKFELVADHNAQLVKVTFTDAQGGVMFLVPKMTRADMAKRLSENFRVTAK